MRRVFSQRLSRRFPRGVSRVARMPLYLLVVFILASPGSPSSKVASVSTASTSGVQVALATSSPEKIDPGLAVPQLPLVSQAELDIGQMVSLPAGAQLAQDPTMLQSSGVKGTLMKAVRAGYGKLTVHEAGVTTKIDLFVSPLASVQSSRTDIDWYRTQYGTGVGNCGPALVSMGIAWATGRNVSVETIRSEIGYPYKDGSTDFSMLLRSLRRHDIDVCVRVVKDQDDLRSIVDRGEIAFVLIDTSDIPMSKKDPRTDLFGRYYPDDMDHYVLIKGYSTDDRYFIVYDPYPADWNGNTERYADGTSMIGKNRFYLASSLMTALITGTVLDLSRS